MFETLNLAIALPELILILGAIALLMVGVFSNSNVTKMLHISAMALALVVVTIFIIFTQGSEEATAFFGSFYVSDFTKAFKIILLIGTGFAILMAIEFKKRENFTQFELPVLMLLAAAGMMVMVSANDMATLYLGLELQSLSLYVLAAIHRDNVKATEAGLKYFVLGALSSGMLLYGISLIYGFTGSIGYSQIASSIASGNANEIGVIFGIVFILAGLAFKISAAPFHMWTPDVYEGSPTPITAFFASAPKVAAMALLARVSMEAFAPMGDAWQQIIIFLAVASMALGAVAAIAQSDIKRLMAYSSIGNMGFALVGLAAQNEKGIYGLLLYITIYMFMTLGAFACIQAMQKDKVSLTKISDLAGCGKSNPFLAILLTLIMFSMIGIPPLAGFFAKFYAFLAAVDAGLYPLAIIGVVLSVISAYYYLRVIKVMFFDEGEYDHDPMAGELKIVLAASSAVIILFVLFKLAVDDFMLQAAAAMFN